MSRAGRLVLIKSVLMEIPVYWASLSWVPKGILSSIDKLCRNFLWIGTKQDKVSPWVAWDKISKSKEWGGLGIKNLPSFAKSLAAKLAWHLISTYSLWTSVIKRKYIDQGSVLDWIRSPVKSSKKASIVWKAVVASVQTIERGLAWHVGDGTQVRLGCDPWVGCSDNFSLSPGLVEYINERRSFSLNHVANPRTTTLVKQGWLSRFELQLEDKWLEEWNRYVSALTFSSVRISDSSDELRWVHAQSGLYSPQSGYKWLMAQEGWGAPN